MRCFGGRLAVLEVASTIVEAGIFWHDGGSVHFGGRSGGSGGLIKFVPIQNYLNHFKMAPY